MPPWMERRCGTLGIALLALTAFLAPRWIVSGLTATGSGTPLISVAMAAPRKDKPPFHSTDAASILAHNVFDSTRPAAPEVDAAPPASLADRLGGGGAPPCPGVRVSAIAFSADPDWSMAALALDDGAQTTSLLRRRGGKVGERVVDYVAVDRVFLAESQDVCVAGFAIPPPPVPAAHTPAKPSAGPPAGAVSGIVRTGPKEFEVERSVIERVRQDPTQLMAFGQLVPERDASGTTLGVRLATLKPGTLPTALGLESGDRLDSINGYHVANLEELLGVYARLSTADRVTLEIVRQGHAQSISYTIR
jgi:general secretion pathway protein C